MWPGVLLSSVSFVSDLMDLVTTTVPEDPQVPHSKLQTTTTGSENIHMMSSCSASCWTSSYCMEALIVYCYITRLNLLLLPADTPAHEWRNRMPSTAELTKAHATTDQLEKNSFRSKTEGRRRVCEDKGTNASVAVWGYFGTVWTVLPGKGFLGIRLHYYKYPHAARQSHAHWTTHEHLNFDGFLMTFVWTIYKKSHLVLYFNLQ